jgi:hypothetical protein
VARFGAVLDRLDAERVDADVDGRLPECADQALALFEALQPVLGITIRLGAGPPPGVDAVRMRRGVRKSRWPAARFWLGKQQGSTAGSLTTACWLLDRIDELIGARPADSWNDAVGSRVQELVEARQRGSATRPGAPQQPTETHASNESPSVGGCATPTIIGCTKRSIASLTQSAVRRSRI